MRLLFAIDSLTKGGAERVVVNLACYFRGLGHEVHIAVLFPDLELRNELPGDIPVHIIRKRGRFDWRVLFKMRDLIRKIKPDLINTHLFTASLWTKIACIGNRIPIYVTYHNVLWEEEWYTPFHKMANLLLKRRVKTHIFVGDDVALFFLRIEDLRGKVVYNGIDVEKYRYNPRREMSRLFFVGRLIERKGVRDLFKIMDRLGREHTLRICGHGPLATLVRSKLRPGIEFYPSCDPSAFFSEEGILLLPSYWEGFALVVLEAFASGMPIIAYRAKGLVNHPLRAYIDFVPRGDIGAFTEKIRSMAYDREKAEMARHIVEEEFSIVSMGKRYKEIFGI